MTQSKRCFHFQAYRARDGWRWRMRAPNGRTVAEGGEAYTTHAGVRRAIRMVCLAISLGVSADPLPVVELS